MSSISYIVPEVDGSFEQFWKNLSSFSVEIFYKTDLDFEDILEARDVAVGVSHSVLDKNQGITLGEDLKNIKLVHLFFALLQGVELTKKVLWMGFTFRLQLW